MPSTRYKVWQYVRDCGEFGATPRQVAKAFAGVSAQTISSMLLKLVADQCLSRASLGDYKCRKTYRYQWVDGMCEPSKTRGPVVRPASFQAADEPTPGVEPYSLPTPAMNAFLGIRGVQ